MCLHGALYAMTKGIEAHPPNSGEATLVSSMRTFWVRSQAKHVALVLLFFKRLMASSCSAYLDGRFINSPAARQHDASGEIERDSS
jgi:hypothetical protein